MSWQREKRELVRDIAMALHYLHDRATPIIHRDVRAKNVVLSEKFKGVLIDFAVSRDRALATMTAGEILRNVKYDERSDIYSFGVLLTELDTCKRPYHDLKDRRSGKELRPLQILPMVMAGTARPSLTKDCPQDIRALAKRCLDPDPMRRPTASDVLKVLHGSDRSEAKQSPVLTMEQLSISEPPIAPSTAPSSTSYMPAVADAVFEPLQQDRNVRERWVPLDSVVMEQLIARGEFGEVWLARLRGEAVAVKRLPQSAELEREDVELFVHEIKLTASLSHANVIRFRGLSWSPTATHSLCMALDYHSQGTLQRMLRRAGNMMNWTHKLHFALGIAQALHYLHGRAHPVIHRDVKSKNVVVSDKCEAILIDFSIGRESVQKTMTMGVGTPYWTAPEQLKGSRYDSTSDIYAFGVFLSELDTCQEPYHDAKDPKTGRLLSPLQILRMVTNGRIVPTFTRECPMRVLQAAQRCLEFNSADRPSARELVQMLKSSRRK
ncbi:TPA: hypothetical protein N0F65_007931 [Lagenidium giganteum]|uniref:Protein kinase domain-containing protein n=1 Tax=Lagenidium giganteum TaxID=4803 RepID=A0AAV2YHJ6_9STRA|nr:TPA: hypothetical protein N0F65_007931 [Lagenidium giganteum]